MKQLEQSEQLDIKNWAIDWAVDSAVDSAACSEEEKGGRLDDEKGENGD